MGRRQELEKRQTLLSRFGRLIALRLARGGRLGFQVVPGAAEEAHHDGRDESVALDGLLEALHLGLGEILRISS